MKRAWLIARGLYHAPGLTRIVLWQEARQRLLRLALKAIRVSARLSRRGVLGRRGVMGIVYLSAQVVRASDWCDRKALETKP